MKLWVTRETLSNLAITVRGKDGEEQKMSIIKMGTEARGCALHGSLCRQGSKRNWLKMKKTVEWWCRITAKHCLRLKKSPKDEKENEEKLAISQIKYVTPASSCGITMNLSLLREFKLLAVRGGMRDYLYENELLELDRRRQPENLLSFQGSTDFGSLFL